MPPVRRSGPERGPVRPSFPSARRIARVALVVVGFGLAAFDAPPARAQLDLPSELQTVARVRFEGRRRVPRKELEAVLKTQSERLFWRDRPLLRTDFLRVDTLAIQSVYRQHGYLDAHVDYALAPASEPGAVIVTFRIHEGPRTRIGRVEFAGATVVSHGDLRKPLFAKPGKPYNPFFLVADTARIAAVYQDRGYFPRVTAATERDSLRMHVRYTIEEGPLYRFGPVTLDSSIALGVDESFVRRELLLRKGTVYRSTRVQQSVERLYETGVFAAVEVVQEVDPDSQEVSFLLRLRPRRPHWVDAGIGSGTTERFQTSAEWGNRNLFGRGMQGALAGRVALDEQARFQIGRVSASLLEPWLLRTRTRGLVTVYFENFHDRASPDTVLETQTQGVTFELRRQLGRHARASIIQDNAFVDQEYRIRSVVVPDTGGIVSSFTTHRLRLALDRDTRDHPINMNRGSAQALTAEIAGGPFQGTSSFTKQQLASSWYTPIPRREGWIFATRVRAGAIQPFGKTVQFSPGETEAVRVPPNDRFRLGGVNTVRGYDENKLRSDGGLVVLLANAELRVPVWGPLGLEVYADAGNVWTSAEDVYDGRFGPRFASALYGANDVRWAFGFGPRLQLPFGPLRVDFTWWAQTDRTGDKNDDGTDETSRRRGRWQFAIGPSF